MSVSGCSVVKLLTGSASEQSGKKNPLRGKDTDERIVMCMEETYPEHEFLVKTSFDKSKDCGVFQDEKMCIRDSSKGKRNEYSSQEGLGSEK